MKFVDYIIVGQGIAGTLLAYKLECLGKRILIFDPNHRDAASLVSAGIINPITGRRFVKAWMYDVHIKHAVKVYHSIERKVATAVLHERNILRTLFSNKDENDWHARRSLSHYNEFMLPNSNLGQYATVLNHQYAYGEVTGSYQVNMPSIVTIMGQQWLEVGNLLPTQLNYEDLVWERNQVRYQSYAADGIIFCEGQQARQNPFFCDLPLGDSKGQILKVRIAGFRPDRLIKQRYFIVPLEEDVFWFGPTDQWDAKNADITAEARTDLERALTSMINLPFSVESHLAALRPTTPDRRPLLGTHHLNPKVHIFNGLGTKGASLAPYWAQKMVDYLVLGKRLPWEVDVKRFTEDSTSYRNR